MNNKKSNNNNNNSKNKILIIIIFALIIIIILLLLKGCSRDNNVETTISNEGRINVFEIKSNNDCNCECNTKKDDLDDDVELDINVLDDSKTWKDQENINIFGDSAYVVKGKIAPESTGVYQFVVKNSSNYNIKYDIKFSEDNNYHIYMKYKLKKNNNYVVKDWVDFSKLKQTNNILNSSSSDIYYLEWKWFESSNDSSIGENISSNYGLTINVKAVQKNE